MTATLKRDPTPKHHQLTQILREKIANGELKPGDLLPPEEELCVQYGVSRGTVRHALGKLAQAGMISREPGRGTFVNATGNHSLYFTLAGFVEDLRRQGYEPRTRLLQSRIIPAPKEVQRRLRLRPRTPTIHIVRLRLANDRPVLYETRYLAQQLCPDLINQDLENVSIHNLLIQHYHIPLTRAVHTIEVRLLEPSQAQLLEVLPGTPAFFVDRLTYTSGDTPAVWYQAIYNGDEYNFRAEVNLST